MKISMIQRRRIKGDMMHCDRAHKAGYRHNILLLFLVLSVSVIVYGCGKSGDGSIPNPVTSVEIYKGTKGLEIDFIDGTPPEEVYMENEFHVGLEVKNSGAYDIDEGIITLGIEDDYIGVKEWKNPLYGREGPSEEKNAAITLRGKTIERPYGDQGIISLKLISKKFPDIQSQYHLSSLYFTSCYIYQTTATSAVCIDDGSINAADIEKPCEARDIKLDDQGAPVAVTRIEPAMYPDQEGKISAQFVIQIENKGDGRIINPSEGYVERACTQEALDEKNSRNVFNSALVSAKIAGNELNCNPGNQGTEGTARFVNGKGSIRCVSKDAIDFKGTYTTPITVIVRYGYTETIYRDVMIKRPTTY